MGRNIKIALSSNLSMPRSGDVFRFLPKPRAFMEFMLPILGAMQTIAAAEKLGLDGIELMPRVWPCAGFAGWPWYLMAGLLKGKVLGIHGNAAISRGQMFHWLARGVFSGKKLSGSMWTCMGPWDPRVEELAKKVRAGYIAIHPEQVEPLVENGWLHLPSKLLAVEPGWTTSDHREERWERWHPEGIIRSLDEYDIRKVIFDVAHTQVMGLSLLDTWEAFGTDRIVAIHFSGSKDGDPWRHGMPPQLLSERQQTEIQDLLRHIKAIGWNGIITIEIRHNAAWRRQCSPTLAQKLARDFIWENLR